jgi:hypothetical protein
LAHPDVGATIAEVDDVIDLDADHLGQAQPGFNSHIFVRGETAERKGPHPSYGS